MGYKVWTSMSRWSGVGVGVLCVVRWVGVVSVVHGLGVGLVRC